MKKRVLFAIKVHSVIDVITNSSSELFVGKAQSKAIMEEMIQAAYPEYKNEYCDLLSIDELSVDDLDNYFDYACSAHVWPATKRQMPVLKGFTFDELYEPNPRDEGKPAWNGHIQYKLKNNDPDPKHPWSRSFITEENIEQMKNKLDPKREMYFLYSKEENPNWDMQEKLMNIMTRHHLG